MKFSKENVFYKMHAAGNDFILIDNRRQLFSEGDWSKYKKLCAPHTGIGADGIILITESELTDFKLNYYNADGHTAAMCGNGARCAVYFAHSMGIAPKQCCFEIRGNVYHAEVLANQVVNLLMPPSKLLMDNHKLSALLQGQFQSALWVDTGVPHLVVNCTDKLKDLDVDTWGKYFRSHKLFEPKGTNVNFIKRCQESLLKVRVYERGVEKETLACGTGAVACGIFAAKNFGWKSPIIVESPGGELYLEFKNIFSPVYLQGPVSLVYKGRLAGDFLETR